MPSPSAFDTPYGDPNDASIQSAWKRLNDPRRPFGTASIVNQERTPVGRNMLDPYRVAGMVSRGTAKPRHVAALAVIDRAQSSGRQAAYDDARTQQALAEAQYYQSQLPGAQQATNTTAAAAAAASPAGQAAGQTVADVGQTVLPSVIPGGGGSGWASLIGNLNIPDIIKNYGKQMIRKKPPVAP